MAARHDAAVAPTPREAVREADVVLVSLADDAAVTATYGGADGLVAGLAAGQVVADTSTVDPETLRGLEAAVVAAGAALLDTPVSGSVSTVEAGALLVMAGGDASALERARPALEAIASRIVHLGPLGAGATMKLVVNAMVHALNGALAEALVLAEKAGLDRARPMTSSPRAPWVRPSWPTSATPTSSPEGTPVAFALNLVAKDLALADALAARVAAPMPQLATNREVVQRAVAAGLGDADLSALATLLRAGAL